MIIDTKNYLLKYNLKKIDLTPRQLKIILLLSDNKTHNIREIRRYIKLVTDLGTTLEIKKLNQKIINLAKIKLILRAKNNYRICREVYIS